jgi:hypothetical protein
MANPFSGIISQDLKDLFVNLIDSLLETTALTQPCRFIYGGTKFEQCPNCSFNASTGKSNNLYVPGGPISFSHGLCPVCNGAGRKEIPITEDDIYMGIIYDHKKWLPMGFTPTSPNTSIQTISSITLMPKIKRAKEIIVNTDIETYVRQRYVIDGEPQPYGFGNDAYIATIWKRSG